MLNRETINNRFKLAYHRIVARRMKTNPSVTLKAKEIVADWNKLPTPPTYAVAWKDLLSLPDSVVGHELTRRSEWHDFLRINSPFGILGELIMSEHDRQRLWQVINRSKVTS